MDPMMLVLVVTAVAGVITAVGLYLLANQRMQIQVDVTKAQDQAVGTSALSSDDPVEATVLNALNRLPAPPSEQRQVAAALSHLVRQEVNRQKAEVAQKYETMVKVKERELGAVTEKFKRLGEEFKVTQVKYKQVQAEKNQTESIVRSVAEGVIVVNNKGEVLLMNPAAERLLGAPQRDRLGQPVMGDLKEGRLISMVKPGADPGSREIEVGSQDDKTKKTLRASTAVIEDENGQTVGMVSVLSDVTKQKEYEQMKANFFNNVSHELRTPIVTIQKALGIVKEQSNGLTDTQQKFLAIAERNIQNLSHLVNDLLDMAKMEAGKMTLALGRHAIGEVIKNTVENLEPWARAKGVTLERAVADGLAELELDPKRIGQVLTNLIGNAIKFTPAGGKVTTSATQQEAVVEISVADTGVGIAKEDLPKVFSRFQQFGERMTTDVSGTGLGLSIAKEIVELHRGTIRVESEVGKGTVFTFSLPVPA